ncbi:Predicted nuclease of restriction endonuclease-like (RecB) superfamily, DUF1016 family [Thiothrix caldifontis]|uniref:Predicted nuclease of restriction endonuclease-like (RecB) superfamily, DUF1016 family n=1 Tax=Thiothrix caldifontis TaxID=525918 RepID=A0A1H4G295_9GAMM|nr:PDDEXK nuclease domain-containing protein [Thiothrix caldifontis]SEB03746.1 Predicted nuclease of restriction endonuclease-like (RecB) superfamily, DUF1016 family [Thiothrix caldifontis]
MNNSSKQTDVALSIQPLIESLSLIIEQGRGQLKQSVNSVMLQSYWQMGRVIVEHEQQGQARAAYGTQQLQQIAQHLTQQFGKGFDVSNLRNMRRLSSKDPAPIIQEAQERTAALQQNAKDYLRDPYILDFLNLPSKHMLESDLEQGLIDNLQRFLLELGKGFAFVERQQRVRTADQDFYIDLVFYHFKLKCFLLIDLKIGKLNHQDVGQMDTYVRIYDQHKKGDDDNPTIGLILCSQKSEAIVKYSVLTDSQQLFAAKYLPYLPTEEELKHELEREREWVQVQLTQQGDFDD